MSWGHLPGDAPQRVMEHLRSRQQAMLDLLERLVERESPSTVPATQQPVQDILCEALGDIGYRVRLLPGRVSGGTLHSVPKSRSRPVPYQVMIGHTDTVWPIGTLSEMPIRLDDGRFYGPGTYDMKGGLVQGIFAVDALQECLGQPAVTPVFLINSDEEIGSPDSEAHVVRMAKRADRALVLEPALEPGARLKTARKGGGHFIIRVTGRAAHAGLEPEKGASAILELSLVIQKLYTLNDPERGVTVNVGTIDGGLRPNVVAPESRAEVDVRVLTREDARRVEEFVHDLVPTTAGTSIEVEGSVSRPPMEKTPGNRRLWEAAREVGELLGIELEEGTSGGGSDGNTTSLYTPTLDGLGVVGAGAHASHEHAVLGQMPERAAVLALLLAAPSLRPERGLVGAQAGRHDD